MHSILESEGNWGRVAWDYPGIILGLSWHYPLEFIYITNHYYLDLDSLKLSPLGPHRGQPHHPRAPPPGAPDLCEVPQIRCPQRGCDQFLKKTDAAPARLKGPTPSSPAGRLNLQVQGF